MDSIEKQINKDAMAFQEELNSKFQKFNEKAKDAKPITVDVAKAYMRGYRKYNGAPFVIKISRSVIAYLYKQMYEESKAKGKPMAGDLAVAIANYTPEELKTPQKPDDSDPNWKPEKAYQNAGIIGYWDKANGVKPFTARIPTPGGIITVEYYDDWNDEWP